MSIAQNTALFSLLGTTYGGDGQSTFALPDLRGRAAVGTFQGPGLSYWDLGEVQGSESVTLITSNLPVHSHPVSATVTPFANNGTSSNSSPTNAFPSSAVGVDMYNSATNTTMAPTSFTFNAGITGSNAPHENRMPFLALNFIICTEGIYPSRN